MAEAPTSYKDPYWTQLASATEQKLDLPPGLLVGVLTRGERSNADQVSDAGAKTPFQIIPATRKAAIDKYGIDPYLSPDNAAEVAGKLLKDSLDRNKGDVPAAVGEYVGGTDRANWGPTTRAYVKRVTGAMPAPADPGPQTDSPAAGAGPSTFDKLWGAANAPQPNQVANILKAYQSGQMAPEDAQQFKADVDAGHIMLPPGATLQASAPPPSAMGQTGAAAALPPGVVDAFDAGKITGKDREQLLADVASGQVAAPPGSQLELTAKYPNRDYRSAQIPGTTVLRDEQGRPYVDNTPNAAATLGDKAVGAGEAALSMTTAPVGYVAGIGSAVKDLGAAAINRLQGGAPLPDNVEANANAAGQALTYAPRTDLGQQYAQAAGEAMQPLAGLAPAEAGMMHGGAAPIVQGVRNVARAAPGAAIDAAQGLGDAARAGAGAVSDAVGSVVGRPPAAAAVAEATPGTMGSVGAAGTDIVLQRREAAASLPVPIKLTKGQESRTFEQMRFEEETAKDGKLGEALRENSADQNAKIPQNFDRMIDQTGAEAVAPADVGRAVVDNGLVKDAAKAKAEYRAKYKLAEQAGEMQDPVALQDLVQHLNDSAPEATTAPLLTTARNLAVKLGIAGEGEDGNLVASPSVTLANAERFRQAINRNTGIEPTNVRQATIMKGLIDEATDGAGGQLYAQARKSRQRYAQLYEDNAVVSDLLAARRGTSDRKVALENVFDRTVLNGSREDLSNLRRTLHVSGTQDGVQAWRELQGATLRYLNEESTKGVGTDIRGNPIVSPARLNNAVRALDAGGKLDFILGKSGAQTVRDLNEIVKVIKTAPPGAVNFSNTASVLLGALSDFKTVGGGAAESALMGALTGLPIPVLTGIRTGLRVVKQSAANRETLRRVDEALGRATAKARAVKPTRPAKTTHTPKPAPKNLH